MNVARVPRNPVPATSAIKTTRFTCDAALGLNQTIMMALAMVVVASLVGAPGLGQDVMVALSQANSGRGLVAGLSVAMLAIVFDRIIQAWSADRKRALGLG